MQVHVRLRGRLRDLLPRQAKGQTTVELEPGATLADLLLELKVEDRNLAAAVNSEIVPEHDHVLQPGDEVQLFMGIGGG